MSNRLAGMNEFRDTLRDQASKFVTRDELHTTIVKLESDIDTLKSIADKAAGKASQNALLLTAGVSIVGLIIAIVSLFAR
jgi:hypothetical protein